MREIKTIKNIDRFPNLREAKNAVLAAGLAEDEDGATKYIKDHVRLESWYQKKIRDHIVANYPGAVIWKAAAGPFSSIGIPDLNVVYEGKFYGFEVKRPYFGKPTESQIRMIERLNKAGGVAAVVRFPDEVDKIIRGEEVNEVDG